MASKQQTEKFSKFAQAFISYGSYHYDTVNKIIHIVCIPLIAATLFSLFNYIPIHYTIHNLPIVGSYDFGVAQIMWFIMTSYYIYLSPLFGVISGFAVIGLSFIWKNHFKDYQSQEHFYAVLIIHVVAWLLQFVGHGVFEKRKPALMDNITQILNAPMFVLMQLCEMLHIRTSQLMVWKEQIRKNVEQFRSQNNKNKVA